MEWFSYTSKCWINGMPKSVLDSTGQFVYKYCIGHTDNPNELFIIIPIYTKKYVLSKYSVWYQDRDMATHGGNNFALKIKNCSSFREGAKIAEEFYEQAKNNKEPHAIGTQYMDWVGSHHNFFD